MLDPKGIEAACAATVLGEDECEKPVHLEPREAETAITAYLSTVTPAEVGGMVGAQIEARAIAEAARRLVRNTIDAIAVEELVQDRVAAALRTLTIRNSELEREVKRLRDAQIWRGMDSAPKAGERILLAWNPVGGLSEHVELGKWKDRQGWSNTYGHAFSEAPDAWASLAPFSTSPQGGEHE